MSTQRLSRIAFATLEFCVAALENDYSLLHTDCAVSYQPIYRIDDAAASVVSYGAMMTVAGWYAFANTFTRRAVATEVFGFCLQGQHL